jgi:hypothetical protein
MWLSPDYSFSGGEPTFQPKKESVYYVHVAQDILLMETETGMVVDAIDNLNWEFNR